MKTQTRRAGPLEVAAWGLGCSLLAVYAAGDFYISRSGEAAVQEFRAGKQNVVAQPSNHGATEAALGAPREPADRPAIVRADGGQASERHTPRSFSTVRAPDTSNWSRSRSEQHSAAVNPGTPAAILRIDALDLEVPVYVGTSEWNLNRGAALIEGTAALGTNGNVGLAAHRDGYFRALRDIELGDRVELETPAARTRYLVTEIRVVSPRDIEVLEPTQTSALTLVTCYPFYFVGPAPERFVVRAELVPGANRAPEEI